MLSGYESDRPLDKYYSITELTREFGV
ncbi:MAG TPA: MerR family transcriptional regulator, partial [Agrobacterium sp.]|nr:MerR family transcriptional regulator [Agrobacterium sp.]